MSGGLGRGGAAARPVPRHTVTVGRGTRPCNWGEASGWGGGGHARSMQRLGCIYCAGVAADGAGGGQQHALALSAVTGRYMTGSEPSMPQVLAAAHLKATPPRLPGSHRSCPGVVLRQVHGLHPKLAVCTHCTASCGAVRMKHDKHAVAHNHWCAKVPPLVPVCCGGRGAGGTSVSGQCRTSPVMMLWGTEWFLLNRFCDRSIER